LSRLCRSPASLWLLDDPCTALDKTGVAQLERHLATHCEQGGMVVLTTHHSLVEMPAGFREIDLGQRAA